jgi:tol-pal system protein YbgF
MILRRTLLILAACVASSGCFATRNDVRILQGDVLAFRTETLRADSARTQQIELLARTLGVVNDSLREVNNRIARFQGDTRGELRSIHEQLLQVQEIVGVSRATVDRLRADFETRQSETPVPAVPVTPTDSTRPQTPATPGPNALWAMADDQLRRGSYGSARTVLEDLLRNYPTSELAPDAQLRIAESYAAENNVPAADSAFTLVATNHPKSPRAATALYKLGLSQARQGKRVEAKATMAKVARDYPASDEADLANEWLRANPG